MADKNPKNIIHVEITDSVGDGGTFYGDHVVVGDPFEDPPDNWEHGQLLFDGNEEDPWGGDGDGGGPHGHSQYALVEHDHDYLPLAGGTLTGDLAVNGVTTVTGLDARANGSASATNPNITFGNSGVNAQTGFFRNSTGAIQAACEGEQVFRFTKPTTIVYNDLQVDGNTDAIINAPADAWGRSVRGTVFVDHGMTSGTQGSFATAMTSNGYRNDSGGWTSLGLNGQAGATVTELHPTGRFYVRTATTQNTASPAPPLQFEVNESFTKAHGNLLVVGTITGQVAFGITEGIDTADVLDRAETATMPAFDGEGVATTDAEVESLTVNEVMTAMLAKIKELSARIEELESN